MRPELLARSSNRGPHLPGGRVDLEETYKRIDNAEIVLDPVLFLKQLQPERTCVNCLFPLIYGLHFQTYADLIVLLGSAC